MSYDHKAIEKKWQGEWLKKGVYTPHITSSNNPFYNLWMFPYPSAEGLHAGHAFASTGSDIYGRFMRMQGKDVFQPIGYDSFGIHSENFALKIGKHPQEMLDATTKHYEEQLKSLGHGYDWTRTVTTSEPDYYKWTQWLFIQLFKTGLAYRAKSEVNWCPKDLTVLADEQVIDGKCERCGAVVEKRDLEQWFFRITSYADRLLTNLDKIDWSERVVTAQRNWIGQSLGMFIEFKTEKSKIKVFTTRPDTLNAVTFIATSRLYDEGSKEKEGKFTGEYAVSPLDGRKIPIWDTNYVAPAYGTGIIMGVPAHDERDMEFAKKYHLDVIQKEPDVSLWDKIEEEGWGEKHTNYHLRDWLISRQRYWGPPIPMIYCDKCAKDNKGFIGSNENKLVHKENEDWDWQGWWPVPEEDLPVLLPYLSDYQPKGAGGGPLAAHPEFYNVVCPNCGSKAKRETDVSDTFLDSSWYFLRYPSVGSERAEKLPFDAEITKKWLPVSLYFGGAEHAVLHLMYSRFVTMVLHDLSYLDFEEPFPRFYAHGLMIKEGAKMSKSKGNVVNPDEYIAKFGADALRMYVMFIGPMDASPDFRDTGMEGMKRFVDRVWRLFNEYRDIVLTDKKDSQELTIKIHQTIKKVTDDVENFRYNTGISGIMEFVNLLYEKAKKAPKIKGKIRCAEWDEALKTLTLLLAPFAPHMAEEVWVNVLSQKFSVHTSNWPKYDIDLSREEEIVIVIQIDGKLRSQLLVGKNVGDNEEKMMEMAKKDPKVEKWLEGKKIKKSVFVPEKLINFVTN